MTPISIPLPMDLQCRIQNMEHEIFYLWMIISHNGLWEEAKKFLSNTRKCGYDKIYRDEFPF